MVQPLDWRLMTEATFQQKASEQDDTLARQTARIESIEVLGGLAPGDVSDATVKSLVSQPASETTTALNKGYVGRDVTLTSRLVPLLKVVEQSDSTANLIDLEDTAGSRARMLAIRHYGDGSGGNGQTYGIDISNRKGAKSALVIHQYSKNGPALWIDNTDTVPSLRIYNAQNLSYNPDSDHGTGAFFEFRPWDSGGSFFLEEDLAFNNQTTKSVTFRTETAQNHALSVETGAAIVGFNVRKTGTKAGDAANIENFGTGRALRISQRGAQTGVKIDMDAASAGFWALDIAGQAHGLQVKTTGDNGQALVLNKAGTGAGEAVRIFNAGTGATMQFRNASSTLSLIAANGEYEHQIAGAGIILKAPNGTRYRLAVANGGTLAITAA